MAMLATHDLACALCKRRGHALALATVQWDGQPVCVCVACRRAHGWSCQQPGCRREQIGERHPMGRLVYCAPCATAATWPVAP